MSRINILTVSDLHLTSRRAIDQKVVLNAFFDDLKRQTETDLSPNFIVISGDLINDPDEVSAYDHFTEHFLMPLLEVAGVDLDRIIIVPGNHDVSRGVCSKYKQDLENITQQLSNHKYSNEIFSDGVAPDLLVRKLESFNEFFQSLSSGHLGRSQLYYDVFDFPELNIAFIAFNTALFSFASMAGLEQGRLLYPDLAINEAFLKIPAGRFVVTVQHHPLSWLQERSSTEAQRSLLHSANLLLYGHLHDPVPSTLKSALGNTAFVQAPSLFSSRDYLNGYSITSISPDQSSIAVCFRTYFDGRRAFDVGTNVIEQGVFYPNTESKKFWIDQPLDINLKKFRRWLTEHVLVDTSGFLNETSVGRKLSDVFVWPPLVSIEMKTKQESHVAAEEPLSYTKVSHEVFFSLEKNVLIYCPSEHGQTSMCKQIALAYLVRAGELAQPRLPLFIDFNHIRKYEASVINSIKSRGPDLSGLGKRLETILEEGMALILVENVDSTQQEKYATISAFMEKYNKNIYVVFIKSSFGGTIDNFVQVNLPNVGSRMHVQALTRGLLREFLKKWGSHLRAPIDVVVDQIRGRFKQLGLPLTPVYLTLLLHVFERDPSFEPTNSASLVENFVERLLGKQQDNSKRQAFDYRNQLSVLGYLAERMTRDGRYLVEFSELYDWTKDYLSEIGIRHDAKELLSSFERSGVFLLIGNSYQFQHNMFLSYFTAQRMISNEDFRRIIIEQAHRFPQEVDIYCGLRRFDQGVLDFLEAKFDDVDRRLAEQFVGLPDLAVVDAFEVPRDDTMQEILLSLNRQLLGDGLSDKERDDLLDDEGMDAERAPIRRISNQLSRPEVKYIALEWYQTLRAYSLALKNLEEVSAEAKGHHLFKLLNAWARMIGYLIMLLRLSFESKLELGGITIDLGAGFGELKPVFLRWLLAAVPTVVSDFLQNDLATEKLEAFLSSTKPDGNESTAIRFLNETMYLDLRLPHYLRRTQAFRGSIKGRLFFCESLLMKLQSSYVRFPPKEEQLDHGYRAMLAEAFADIAGNVKGEDRTRTIDRKMLELEKKKLVARLRGDA